MEGEIKILSIGNFGTGWDGSICDEEHIAKTLEELGHKVIRSQRHEAVSGIGAGGEEHIDFTLVAQWDNYDVNLLSNLPKPVVYWAFDYQADGQEWHERLIKESNLYLSKRIADSKYPNWQWLAQDFAPKFLDKLATPPDKDIDVLFTGSYLPWATERNETIKAVNENFSLVVHSINDWPFLERRPPVMDEGLPELYARAKVILSIDHTLEAGYWSDRNAQIMCCGRRPLFRYIPLSEQAFHYHVDYFHNIEECLKKIEKNMAGTPEQDEDAYMHGRENLKVFNRVQDLLTIVRSIL